MAAATEPDEVDAEQPLEAGDLSVQLLSPAGTEPAALDLLPVVDEQPLADAASADEDQPVLIELQADPEPQAAALELAELEQLEALEIPQQYVQMVEDSEPQAAETVQFCEVVSFELETLSATEEEWQPADSDSSAEPGAPLDFVTVVGYPGVGLIAHSVDELPRLLAASLGGGVGLFPAEPAPPTAQADAADDDTDSEDANWGSPAWCEAIWGEPDLTARLPLEQPEIDAESIQPIAAAPELPQPAELSSEQEVAQANRAMPEAGFPGAEFITVGEAEPEAVAAAVQPIASEESAALQTLRVVPIVRGLPLLTVGLDDTPVDKLPDVPFKPKQEIPRGFRGEREDENEFSALSIVAKLPSSTPKEAPKEKAKADAPQPLRLRKKTEAVEPSPPGLEPPKPSARVISPEDLDRQTRRSRLSSWLGLGQRQKQQ